jgi:hypothetical protein
MGMVKSECTSQFAWCYDSESILCGGFCGGETFVEALALPSPKLDPPETGG